MSGHGRAEPLGWAEERRALFQSRRVSMYEFEDEAARNKAYWVTHVLQRHTNLFACWCAIDEGGVPWLLGLFDEHFGGDVSMYDGRHVALLASPYIALT